MDHSENLNSEMDVSTILKTGQLNYEKIFTDHKGLIAHKWVHYFYIYDRLFSEYREKNKPLTIMEIGVDRGGSMEIWKKYFPDGSKIHGVDINPECKEISFTENIHFHLGSASDRNFMENTFKDIEFDIILDDGSHICSDVIETFKIMFPKLKNGGLYVVEDLHTSYWPNYGGGKKKGTSSIEYFKNFVEALNVDYICPNIVRVAKRLNLNFINKAMSILEKNVYRQYSNGIDFPKFIESITFYDSICAIKKYSSPKNNPFKSIITGDKNFNGVNCCKNELEFIQSVKNIFGTENS